MDKISLTGQLIQYLFTGITVGSIYALVALGFNIIYNVTEVINFAQGEFVMLGGLMMVFFAAPASLPHTSGKIMKRATIAAMNNLFLYIF